MIPLLGWAAAYWEWWGSSGMVVFQFFPSVKSINISVLVMTFIDYEHSIIETRQLFRYISFSYSALSWFRNLLESLFLAVCIIWNVKFHLSSSLILNSPWGWPMDHYSEIRTLPYGIVATVPWWLLSLFHGLYRTLLCFVVNAMEFISKLFYYQVYHNLRLNLTPFCHLATYLK